jgi:hypothetical protein
MLVMSAERGRATSTDPGVPGIVDDERAADKVPQRPKMGHIPMWEDL